MFSSDGESERAILEKRTTKIFEALRSLHAFSIPRREYLQLSNLPRVSYFAGSKLATPRKVLESTLNTSK